MKFEKNVKLKNGKNLILRNAEISDSAELIRVFNETHAETDFLYTYPDENNLTIESESEFIEKVKNSENEIEILAFLDNKLVGSAGIEAIGNKYKNKHRSEFGISVSKAYWGLGIGRALTEAAIECAKDAGYEQLELNVVSENEKAISLYESVGFVKFGENPKGFKLRTGEYQSLTYMLLEL